MTALLLAACTQYEMPGDGNTLPEGVYPLEIASVAMDVQGSQQPWSADAPQTRVSESYSRDFSRWDQGDKIKVQIGDGTPGTYTYEPPRLLDVAEGDAPAYWTSKADNQSIRAWHTSSGNGTVELDKQTQDLAYVLTAEVTANFNKRPELIFSHALAKVRVVLEGSDADKVDDVKIKTYTSCTFNEDGTLTAGDTEDYIYMVPVVFDGSDEIAFWEANVVPTEAVTDGYKISGFKVKIKDSDTYVNGTLKGDGIAPAKAKVNTITLTVGKGLTEIKGGETIDKPGDYIITGRHSETITLNAEGINLTLQDVNVSVSGKDVSAIDIKGGSTVITVEGTNNTLSSSQWGGITMSGSANLTIQGAGKEKSSLTVTAGNNDGFELPMSVLVRLQTLLVET